MSNSKSNSKALDTLKLFRIIFKSANRHFHEVEKMTGIGGAALWALSEIDENKQLTVSALAASMSIHQSTASNLIDKLESDGFISRVRSDKDKRVVFLSITEKGKSVLTKAPQPYRGLLPDALMQFDDESLDALNEKLNALVSMMQKTNVQLAFEPLGIS